MVKNNNKGSLQNYAMHFGTYMGLFWIFKFIFFPLGLHYPTTILLMIFFVLTLSVPFIGYYFARNYRDKVCGGVISFMNVWIFLLLMYLFAAILTAVAHYIYFRYIDNNFIINTYLDQINIIKKSKLLPKDYFSQANLMADEFKTLSPIKITLQIISQNVFFGNILALITSLFVMKRSK